MPCEDLSAQEETLKLLGVTMEPTSWWTEREMKEELEDWNQLKIKSFLLQKKTLNGTSSPLVLRTWERWWERIIHSIWRILRSLFHEQVVSGKTLRTLMAEIEGILNTCLLTPNSDNPTELELLTPNYQLLQRSNLNFPPGIFVKEDFYCQNRWRQV